LISALPSQSQEGTRGGKGKNMESWGEKRGNEKRMGREVGDQRKYEEEH